MIEIKKRNGIWEAYLNGGLMTCNEDLETVLDELKLHVEEILEVVE
jgi:hypothetical protein